MWIWDLRGSCPMSGSTISLSLAAVPLAFLKTKGTLTDLKSFPSSLCACKYILFSLSSLLSPYLLPCKSILLVPARQGAYLTVTQKLITPSCFPAAFSILEDSSCLCPPHADSPRSLVLTTGHGFRPPTIPFISSCVLPRWPPSLVYFNGYSPAR